MLSASLNLFFKERCPRAKKKILQLRNETPALRNSGNDDHDDVTLGKLRTPDLRPRLRMIRSGRCGRSPHHGFGAGAGDAACATPAGHARRARRDHTLPPRDWRRPVVAQAAPEGCGSRPTPPPPRVVPCAPRLSAHPTVRSARSVDQASCGTALAAAAWNCSFRKKENRKQYNHSGGCVHTDWGDDAQ